MQYLLASLLALIINSSVPGETIPISLFDLERSSPFLVDNPDYLAFCTSTAQYNAVLPLLQWHADEGRDVVVYINPSFTDTGARNLVSTYYSMTNSHLRFVLFVGETPYHIYNGDVLSDSWFGDFEHDDYAADVAIGRLPGTVSDITRQVSKTLQYYDPWTYPIDPVMINVMELVLVCSHEDPSYQDICQSMVDHFLTHALHPHPLFAAEEDVTHSVVCSHFRRIVGDSTASSPMTVFYYGHGNKTDWLWDCNPDFEPENLTENSPNGRIVFNLCCDNGDFRNAQPCMSERLINDPYGAVACMGSTQGTWSDEYESFVGLLKGIFWHHYTPSPRFTQNTEDCYVAEWMNYAHRWTVAGYTPLTTDWYQARENAAATLFLGDPGLNHRNTWNIDYYNAENTQLPGTITVYTSNDIELIAESSIDLPVVTVAFDNSSERTISFILNNGPETAECSLFDISGRVVESGTAVRIEGRTYSWSAGDRTPAGIYILAVTNGTEILGTLKVYLE